MTGWVALRVTFDISERGSLLIARDLAPLASQSPTATGRLDARLLGPGSTVVQELLNVFGLVVLVVGAVGLGWA